MAVATARRRAAPSAPVQQFLPSQPCLPSEKKLANPSGYPASGRQPTLRKSRGMLASRRTSPYNARMAISLTITAHPAACLPLVAGDAVAGRKLMGSAGLRQPAAHS